MSTKEEIATVCGYLGLGSAFIFFLCPLAAIIKEFRTSNKTQEKSRSLLSHLLIMIISFLNCYLWFSGSFRGDKLYQEFVYCNLIGAIINLIWLIMFLYLIMKDDMKIIFSILSVVILAVPFIVGYYVLTLSIDTLIKKIISISAGIFNVLMYITPGLNVVKVFQTKNSSLIPIVSCYIGGINCIGWLIYGILKNTYWALIIPNIIGFVLCVTQIILYYMFYPKEEGKSENKWLDSKVKRDSLKKERFIAKRMDENKKMNDIENMI